MDASELSSILLVAWLGAMVSTAVFGILARQLEFLIPVYKFLAVLSLLLWGSTATVCWFITDNTFALFFLPFAALVGFVFAVLEYRYLYHSIPYPEWFPGCPGGKCGLDKKEKLQ